MGKSLIKIDTNGTCFLCREILHRLHPVQFPAPPPSNFSESRSKAKATGCDFYFSFKLLMRYLNISSMQLNMFSLSDYLKETLNNLEDKDIRSFLCKECFDVTERFLMFYDNFEKIQLQLESSVKSIADLIQAGDNSDQRVVEYRRRMRTLRREEMDNVTLGECLRKEIKLKGLEKVVPGVRITNHISDPPSTSTSPLSNALPVSKQVGINTRVKVEIEIQEKNVEDDDNEDDHEPSEAEDNMGSPSWNSNMICMEDSEEEDDDVLPSAGDSSLNVDPLETPIPQTSKSSRKSNYTDFTYNNDDDAVIERDKKLDKSKGGHTCTRCKLQFTSEFLLKIHYYQCQGKSAPLKCVYCPKTFSSLAKSHYPRHIAIFHPLQLHVNEVPLGTTKNDISSCVRGILDEWKNTGGKETPVGCPLCKKNHLSVKFLRGHLLMEHFDKVVLRLHKGLRNPASVSCKECKYCGLSFTSDFSLTFHVRECQYKSALLKCPFCSKLFRDDLFYRMHLTSQHPLELTKDMVADGKSRVYLDDSIEYILKGVKRSVKGKSCRCPCCPTILKEYQYIRPHLLRRHFNIVLEKLQEIVRNPGMKSISQSEDNVTEVTEVLVTKEKRKYHLGGSLICSGCNMEFSSWKNLRSHFFQSHKGTKPYKCPYCEATFGPVTSYRRHASNQHTVEYHTSMLPPGTSLEDVEKGVQEVVKRRRKSGFKSKPAGCPDCQQCFRLLRDLKRHILDKHFDLVAKHLEGSNKRQKIEDGSQIEMEVKMEVSEIKIEYSLDEILP